MWLDDPGHSADRNDLSVESNIQMSARAMMFDMSFEIGIDSLVVVSTVSGVMFTNGKSDSEVALVQGGMGVRPLEDVS